MRGNIRRNGCTGRGIAVPGHCPAGERDVATRGYQARRRAAMPAADAGRAACDRCRNPNSRGKKTAPAEGGFIRRRIVHDLQAYAISPADKLNRIGRTHAAAALAQRAVARAGGVIRLDCIERADLHAFVAVNACAFNFPLAGAKDVGHRKNRAAWADILAPGSRGLKNPNPRTTKKRTIERTLADADRRDGVPAPRSSVVERLGNEQQPARDNGNGRNKSADQHAEHRGDHRSQEQVIFDMHPPPVISKHPEPF